jgi:exopolyphosphatase/guanosine-5'-triphosphate,3'-diphosphate pyrophosphatase
LSELVAAIDVGTNTCLLLVAEGSPLVVIEDAMRRPQLGKGLIDGGDLDEAARARTLEVLAEFLSIADGHGIPRERCRAVGTAVLRRASNAADFVGQVRELLGLKLEVLSGEEEASLAWEAAAESAAHDGDCLVLDVGGGSSEAAWDAGSQGVSLPIGALGLTERYLESGAAEGWSELGAVLRAELQACPRGIGQNRECLMLGGAAANLVALVRGGAEFEVEGLHGLQATAEQAWYWAHHLQGLGLGERRQLPIESDRARILPAGLACLAALLEHSGVAVGRFSALGLRFGLAARLLRGPQSGSG